MKRVLNFVNTLDGAEHHNHSIPEEWRAADFGQIYKYDECFGLAIFPLYFQKNKAGTEARRAVKERFFESNGYRKDMTEEQEKEIIMQRIEISKENARTDCESCAYCSKKNIRLEISKDDNGGVKEWLFRLSLFSNAAKKENNLPTGSLLFKAIVPAKSAKSVRTILERCYDEVYSISGSKLKYENGKWFLMLCYSFDKPLSAPDEQNAKNIMGVHIAKHNAVMCTFSHNKKVLTIDGGEVLAFSIQVERRRRNIGMASSKHSVLCGDGRVGHGYHTKMEPLEHISNKISNFRNTTNHRYSRQIVNWAVQNKCGVIQIEDLNGLATEELEKYSLLKNWSYYDLISKIEYKAKEFGIKVTKVGYKGLRKWCSDCKAPTIERKNDDDGNEVDICTCCGQIFDTDYNIPKALIIEDIDELIKSQE